ncbi:unnamed protein product [Urochloa decumbens]|uniref:ATP synthase subunit epsilon, mitochondrial n=1 Tax=Urochloa decumbens TaxID=240449 RepID=A0ABC8ZJN6_9POAL
MSATTAAVPFWRAAGMTYIGYSNICAALVRNCLKEPFKSEAASREKVHFSVAKWADGKQEKPKLVFCNCDVSAQDVGPLRVGFLEAQARRL